MSKVTRSRAPLSPVRRWTQWKEPEAQDTIDIIKGRLIKNYGYNEASATDVLGFVASIFARADVKD